MRLRNWVRFVLTIIVIHISFYIWQQAGRYGTMATTSKLNLAICLICWIHLVIGQAYIYMKIWQQKRPQGDSEVM